MEARLGVPVRDLALQMEPDIFSIPRHMTSEMASTMDVYVAVETLVWVTTGVGELDEVGLELYGAELELYGVELLLYGAELELYGVELTPRSCTLEEEEEVGNDDGDDDGGGSDSESDMDAVNGSSDRVTVTAAAAAPRKRAGDGGDPKLSAGLLWFSANDGNSDNGDDDVTVYGVHRRILVPRGVHGVHVDAGQVLDELKGLQQPVAPQRTQAELKQQKKLLQQQGGGGGGQSTDESSSKGHSKQRLWAFVAMDGGYFAGAIIDTQTGDFVAHKTFVRYTTRRKQGGTQSRQDSAMGYAANSAGAQIRRYNEQKLQEEIHSLMEAWRAQLAVCDHILVRVPRTNRKDFFGPASVAATSHPLRWSDSRIREVPVPMARPSLAELRRVYAAVTTVSIAKVVRPATVADAAAAVAEQPKPDVAAGLLGDDGGCDSGSASDSTLEPEPRPDLLAFLHHVAKMIQDPALSDDDIVAYLCEHLEQFLDALSDPAMGLRYLTTTDSVQAFRTPTLLHVASLFGRADLIPFLLDNGEDPAVTSGHPPLFAGGVTAFEIARDRRTRDEFRVYRSEHEGEIDGVDWSRARVPPPLTREQANEGEDRAKAKKRKDKERKKLRERRERRETEERGDQADNEAMDCAQEDIRRSQSRAVDSGVGKLSDAQLRARMLSSAYASAGSSWGLSSSSSSSSLSALASGVIPSSASPQRPVSPNTQRAIDRELRFQAIARRQQQEQQQQSPPRRPAAAAAAALATSTNSAARCTHCNKLLHGLVPFEMFDWQCCSLQ
ncbi:hypothetical protein GGI00_001413, partial [Coemansia sp. RSA 2681]